MANLQQSSEEIWKSVAGYEGHYEVSNTGKVRTLRRGNLLKPHFKRYGQVTLRVNNINRTFRVHRLVAQAFLPLIFNKNCVNHKDGNKENNHVSNLEWCTHRENQDHCSKMGLFQTGKRNYKKKSMRLTEDQVRVLKLNAWKTPIVATAKNLGVATNTVRQIWRGDTWRSVIVES